MNRMASLGTAVVVAATLGLGLSGCADSEDPALIWLLGASAGSTETTTSTGPDEIQDDFVLDVNDVQGSPDFVFDSTVTISLHVTVLDPVAPVAGSLVQFRELSGTQTGRVLFQAATKDSGTVSGNFTVSTTSNRVRLTVRYNQQVYHFDIDISNVLQIDRTLFLTSQVTPIQILDRDGDGVPDEEDQFPDDPRRSATVRFPSDGHYTIAFEDLFPRQGDADFNDFAIHAVQEEDLNAAGEVTRIRADYVHVAKGAGYDHTLHLNLPTDSGGVVRIRRSAPDGSIVSASEQRYERLAEIELMPRSNTTIPQSNTSRSQEFRPGDRFEIEIEPDQALSRFGLGAPPYDLYLYVLNTKQQIHFAGKHFNADGSDRYLDRTGFPWALKVPGNFRWMYERKNIHQAYDLFDDWYLSAGAQHRDWYNTANPEFVVAF